MKVLMIRACVMENMLAETGPWFKLRLSLLEGSSY